MAEIKSTLDLVMEKTRHLVQSEEEKKEAQEKEWSDRARRLLLKLEEGRIKPESLPQTLQDLGDRDTPAFRQALLKLMVQGLLIGKENDSILAGMKHLTAASLGHIIQRIEDLLQEYDRSIIELTLAYRKKILEELKHQGISGSAVLPKVDQDPAWAEARTGMKTQFEARLNQAKAALTERLPSG
ncbi:MAG: hypothetical protein JRI95_02805 [Deltaproteobacteria bacterium]|nr:hypothetical protein [Deltaproteobacteria bacterium]